MAKASSSKSRSATKPTGPNARLQGKPLAPHVSKAVKGNENGNGNWDAGYCNDCASMKVAPVRGSRKSF